MSVIGEYLWSLLPPFLKKKGLIDPQGSTTWNLVAIQGETLDQSKVEIYSMRDQHAMETAQAEHLDTLGNERETMRFSGESDGAFRARIFLAAEQKQKVGTKPHMQTMVHDLGFGVETIEVWTYDRQYWAEFIIRLWDDGRAIAVTQDEFYREVDKVRPAHARAVYRIELPLRTFDGWNFSLEEGLTFPERIQTIRATGDHLLENSSHFDSWSIP